MHEAIRLHYSSEMHAEGRPVALKLSAPTSPTRLTAIGLFSLRATTPLLTVFMNFNVPFLKFDSLLLICDFDGTITSTLETREMLVLWKWKYDDGCEF